MSRRSKKSTFWIVFAIIAIIYIVFWIIFINNVIVKDLKIFEASQSKYKMEEVVKAIQDGDLSAMNFASSGSRFEDGNIYKDTFAANIAGKTITFKESTKSYDTQAPIYDIYAVDSLTAADESHEYTADEKIATANLSASSSEQLMFILSIQTWQVDSIVPVYEVGNEALTIEIPDSFTAYINGIEVDEREMVGEAEDYEEFAYAKEYVTVPQKVTYQAIGLMTKPSVTIRDNEGNEVDVQVNGATYTVSFAASSMETELSEYVLNNAKVYTNFFSGDLANAHNSISGITYMFPEGSDYLTLAENYRLHDMWMYSGHATPVFSNEAVTNYIRYSEDFFQVDVYFEKSMVLTRTGDTRVDVTNSTYYYVYVNGAWVIADMVSIIEE